MYEGHLLSPVPKEYVNRWDYYQVDHQILNDLFDEVVVCNSIYQVLSLERVLLCLLLVVALIYSPNLTL